MQISKPEKNNLLTIKSEKQRLIREKKISLPYHQPEQRLLDDFLSRKRKNLQEQLQLKPVSSDLLNEKNNRIIDISEVTVQSSDSEVNLEISETHNEITQVNNSEKTNQTIELSTNIQFDFKFTDKKFLQPGAKHSYCRETLLKALISQKVANWNEYQNSKEKLYSSNIETCEKKENDYKPEFEPYHPEDELSDEELIEDDIEIIDKKRKSNKFVDEEAEETSDEEEEINESDDENAKESETDEDNLSNYDNIHVSDSEKDNLRENEDAEISQNVKIGDEKTDKFKKSENSFRCQDLSAYEYPKYKISECSLNNRSNNEKSENSENSSSIIQKVVEYNTTGIDLENKVLGFESISSQANEDSLKVTDSQIFGLCSGKFVTQSAPSTLACDFNSSLYDSTQHIEESQDISLILQDTNNESYISEKTTSNKELLLSDESDTEELFNKKKRTAKIVDSDDEYIEKEDEKTNLSNSDKSEENENDNDYYSENEEVNYDSEEEIVDHNMKPINEFFENEAELSESEWESEDENEKDLDEMEKEAGDDDEIDTDKVQEELGRIYMRQVKDDDQENVRILQEILLEDGELHSDSKRQRRFQWKNLDEKDDFFKFTYDSDEEICIDEENEETEENWRKARFERETFISEQEKKISSLQDTYEEDSEFAILSNDLELNNRLENTEIPVTSTKTAANIVKSPSTKLFVNKFKCGSFLSRGNLLSKLSVANNDFKEKENLCGAKNSNNFVFATKSPDKKYSNKKNEKRRNSNVPATSSKKVKLSIPETGRKTNSEIKKWGLLARLDLYDK